MCAELCHAAIQHHLSSSCPCACAHQRLGTAANEYTSPLPISYTDVNDLPESFDWGNVGGVSYLTRSLNQHLPNWCGSCWAHGSLSSLADRIKIAREAAGVDVALSIQYILNCGGDVAGSCHGGSASGLYEFVKRIGFVPFDTCMPYLACSSDLKNGFCEHFDTTCSKMNTCRTCTRDKCEEITTFPNATVAEYGTIIHDTDMIKTELYARGPVAAAINGKPLHMYQGGIFNDTGADKHTTHIVSIVGWGTDKTGHEYWRVRNSWGQYCKLQTQGSSTSHCSRFSLCLMTIFGTGCIFTLCRGRNGLCAHRSDRAKCSWNRK